MATTVYVNSEWTAESVLPEGLTWGVDAFANFKTAYDSVETGGTVKVVGYAEITQSDYQK